MRLVELAIARAAQRLGFSFEEFKRPFTGRNRDTAWYAAIDSEWPSLRRSDLA
jgi:RimJ/RimL family protein N-acetyltransferase